MIMMTILLLVSKHSITCTRVSVRKDSSMSDITKKINLNPHNLLFNSVAPETPAAIATGKIIVALALSCG